MTIIKNNKGFTLIEILVVIALIALLMVMGLISLNSARGRARDAQRMHNAKQMANAFAMEATSDENAVLECGLGSCGAGDDLSLCTGPGTADFTAYPTGEYTLRIGNTVTTGYVEFILEQGINGMSPGTYLMDYEGIIYGPI